MHIDKQNILLTIIIILLVIGGFIMYNQQKTINKLNSITSLNLTPPPVDTNQKAISTIEQPKDLLPRDIVDSAKNNLLVSVKEITGQVVSVSGNTITVEADIVDLNKIAEATTTDNLPRAKKVFTVSTDDKTEFVARKLEQIATGQTIKVLTYEQVYKSTNLTAQRIIDPAMAEPQVQFEKVGSHVNGKVVRIEGNVLTIKVMTSTSTKEEKTYSVKITDKTKLLKMEVPKIDPNGDKPKNIPPIKQTEIKLSDIQPDSQVSIAAFDEVKNLTEFEARTVGVIIYNSIK